MELMFDFLMHANFPPPQITTPQAKWLLMLTLDVNDTGRSFPFKYNGVDFSTR